MLTGLLLFFPAREERERTGRLGTLAERQNRPGLGRVGGLIGARPEPIREGVANNPFGPGWG